MPLLSLAGRDGNEAAGKKASGRLPGERGHGGASLWTGHPLPTAPWFICQPFREGIFIGSLLVGVAWGL